MFTIVFLVMEVWSTRANGRGAHGLYGVAAFLFAIFELGVFTKWLLS